MNFIETLPVNIKDPDMPLAMQNVQTYTSN